MSAAGRPVGNIHLGKFPLCGTCGCNPCISFCPQVDPYFGNPLQEHLDHEAGAAWDDHHERYAEMQPDHGDDPSWLDTAQASDAHAMGGKPGPLVVHDFGTDLANDPLPF